MRPKQSNINHGWKHILCTLALLLVALPHFAQGGKLFNTDNQLSSSFATQVMEDRNGFIWIATRNGLNVYDGYRFTTYTKAKKDNRGFCNNYINCLGEDRQGNIFVGTNNGVMVYDGTHFNSLKMMRNGKEVKSYVNRFLLRHDGTMWVCTSGYGIMQADLLHGRCENVKGEIGKYTFVTTAREDRLGRIWFTTEDAHLHRLEKNGKVTHNLAGTTHLKVLDIAEDHQGNLFLAADQQGVYTMKAGSTAFSRIEALDLPSAERVYAANNHLLYVGTNGQGIVRYDLRSGKVDKDPFFNYQVNLSKAKVNSILEDKQGNIWFSMLQKGVFMQPNKRYDFGYMGFKLGAYNQIGDNCITSVLFARDRRIWLGTDKDYLYSLPIGPNASSRHYTNTPSTILALCEDLQGNIWMGSYREGVGYLDPAGNFHHVDLIKGADLSVFDIKCDPQGNLWFATMGDGLVCLRSDHSTRQYAMTGNADRSLKVNALPNNYLTKLAFSPDYSRLFVATSVGLCCLDIKRDSWVAAFGQNCLNKGSFSHCVQTDRRGRVWYGTEDGIFVYDLQDLSHPQHYTMANGLSTNSIAFIAEDAKGKIWVGTGHGLNCIDPKSGNIQIYHTESGLQSNEFSDGAVSTTPAGDFIVMGGTGGINWFNPQAMKQHRRKTEVFLSNFIVGNDNIYPKQQSGFYTITEKPVWATDAFHLSHYDSSFSIELSTLTFDDVEQICYAYSINGDEWHTLQPGQNDISFSHMPSGTYRFRIKALTGGQESAIREFCVTVHPAWYASIWARIVYLLLVCALAYLYIQHRKKKEHDRLVLQQHIHAEEMGEAKLKFFINISHDIRTPLTLILTPLLTLIREDKDPHRQGIYDVMRKNSERILHLINQMMDLRKIDKGQMPMHMAETDMVAFLQDEYDLFGQQATSKKIDFRFSHDTEALPVWIDRNNFDKVIMNVLSNAFKFTPTGGRIHLALTHTDAHVYICIKDNGCGIAEDKLETIFQRFYQSTSNTAADRNNGTGIGLDLTRSLVELHYGTIVAHNNRGGSDPDFSSGSEFVIRMPLGCAHLKPEEMITQTEDQQPTLTEETDHAELLEEIAPEEETAGNTARPLIALVEDDDDILEYLRSQLQDDYRIITFHNGKEALLEIIRQQPQLVISDIMMPLMDGNTLCARLKSNINTNHIPVILLSAMSREEDQLNGLQTGADAYIVKPFNMEILRRTILNLLSVRHTLRNKFEGKESQEEQVQDVTLSSADDVLMERIMKVINEHLTDEDLSVEMIAREVGISRVHLHRKMKELTNQTPHIFIRNIRLKQAAKLLRESHKNITEVMYACGFSNPASFSTMFKNLYGCSPRNYMNGQNDEE